MLFALRPFPPEPYRFVARITGYALPGVDKVLRLRCTLNAADHSVVGLTALVVPLGVAAVCDEIVELVHAPAARDAALPKYFELIACLAPTAEPTRRLPAAYGSAGAAGGCTEYRIAGIMDPARTHIPLPEIVLRGA